MKKLLRTGLGLFAVAVLFTACKKDHVCTCKYTNSLGVEGTETHTLKNQTRADAVENCENFERNSSFSTINCNL